MITNKFTYNNNNYIFNYNPNDPSELWCIDEIVTNNEYLLDNFTDNINKNFIDIGANCGVATIILAKQNPLSTIYSFEPDPKVYEVLKSNVIINKLDNVKLFNMAVSKPNIDYLKLFYHPLYSGGNTTYSDTESFNNYFHKETESISVKTTSLDEIIKNNNMDYIELLKIDCEGAEYDIIYGSQEFKNNKIKNIAGEFHNLRYNNKVINRAEELIDYSKKYINGIFKISILNV